MSNDIDSRLEAALHRIAVAHVPDHPDGDIAHVDQDNSAGLDAVGPVMHAQHETRKHRVLLGAAAAVLILAGIGALIVLAPRDDSATTPTQSSPTQTAPPEDVPAAQGPPVTLGVINPIASVDTWSRLPDNQLQARSEHLVVATNAGLFVWGGFAGQESLTNGAFYDSETEQWRPIPDAPLAPEGDAIGVWTGAEVVVINGSSGDVKSAAFNPATSTWRKLSDPPVDNAANALSRAVVVGGDVMLFSVFEDGAAPQNQVAILDDIQSGHWSVVDSPPIAMSSGVDLVAKDEDVFVIGRTIDPTGCGELHVLAYTPTDNSWNELPAGPASRLADPVSVWTGTELFVGGGGSCTNGVAATSFEDSAYLLNPATGQWRDAPPAPEGFYSSYRYPDIWTGNAVAAITPTGEPLLYNPTSQQWHLGPAITAEQGIAPNQTPTVLLEGSIIVSSGQPTLNGEICCEAFSGTYAYTVPEGF